MKLLDSYLNELMGINGSYEQLYHASLVQNLKVIKPHMDPAIRQKVVWASFYLPYTATFVMPHTVARFKGVDCDEREDHYCNYWVVEITPKSKPYLNKPCSIYTITPTDSPWEKPQTSLSANKLHPSYTTISNCRVIKEIKYKSVRECFLKNQVGMVFMDMRYGYRL